MQKRIFAQMVLLIFSGIFLVSVTLSLIFYNQFTAQARLDLLERTQIFATDGYQEALANLRLVKPKDMRISFIAPDGTVLFDNMADPHNLASHLDREEIQEALLLGNGESRRFSDTLGRETYYYAVRLTDGTVLRTAKTVDSIGGMFAGILPVTLAVVLLFVTAGYFSAKGLARRVVAPLGKLDLSGEPEVPYDELAPFARTISEHRKQIECDSAKLQDRAATVNAIMDNMYEGVVLLDKGGMILSLNKAAARIFHVSANMEGRNALELLRDLDFQEYIQRALQGQRGEMPFSQAEKEYRVLVSPVADTGVVVLFLDITEKSAAERMRREFSANVSHELKTPLTSIYGHAEMLQGGLVRQEDTPQFYGKIMDEASRLIMLIEDIILLSQLDEGVSRELPTEVDLPAVAVECAAALEQKSAERQVTINISGSGTLPANRSLMYEMFYNLIDNAIKYNKRGGTVNIFIAQTGAELRIVVADSGIGVTPAEQQRIFERFYRVDKSRAKKSGGTGLGLAIVKHVALAHGGNISVKSEIGVGTEFVVVFGNHKL